MKFDGGAAKARPMWIPLLLALVVLGAAGAWFARVYVHPSVTGAVDRVAVYPVHTEYKRGGGMLVGANQTEDAIYVVVDVNLTNRTEVPLFLSGFSGSFIGSDATEFQANVIDKNDLARLRAMFPQLKTVTDSVGGVALERESSVAKNTTGHGYILLSYNVPQSVWDQRKSGKVEIDFYHQDRLTMPIGK